MKRNMTLGVKLLFPILAMVLVGTLASGVLSDRASEKALREAALREAGAKGEGLTRTIGMVFSDTHKALEAISLRPALAALFEPGVSKEDVERACADLEVMRSKYPLFQRLGVLSDKGVTLVANSTPSAVGTNLGKREYFMEALRDNNYMASVATSSISGKQFTAMSVPLAVNGKIVGVLYGAIDIPPFAEQYVDPVRLGNQGYAFELSREGLIIMHPDKDLLGKGGRDVDPVFSRIVQGKKRLLLLCLARYPQAVQLFPGSGNRLGGGHFRHRIRASRARGLLKTAKRHCGAYHPCAYRAADHLPGAGGYRGDGGAGQADARIIGRKQVPGIAVNKPERSAWERSGLFAEKPYLLPGVKG